MRLERIVVRLVRCLLFLLCIPSLAGQSYCTKCTTCPSYASLVNPTLRSSCESATRLTLVIDESRSIADAGVSAIAAVREGVLAFLQDLECTPVQVAVVEFSTHARYVIPSHIPVQQARDCMTNYFDGQGCGGQSYRPEGATNWQAALILAEEIPASDMLIFFTDGVPTAWTVDPTRPESSSDLCTDGTTTEPVEIYNAVQIANKIKQNGTKLFVLGVGNVNLIQLQAVSGPVLFESNGSLASSDYSLVSTFEGLEAAWRSLSQKLCPLMLSCTAEQNSLLGNVVTLDIADDAKAPFTVRYNGLTITSWHEPIKIENLAGGDYTFHISDASVCHRPISCEVNIPIFEDEEPVILKCPSDVRSHCLDQGAAPRIDELPPPLTVLQLGASDDHTPLGDLDVAFEDNGPEIEECAYIFTRSYTVTDHRGQTAQCSHRFEITYDSKGPELLGIPKDKRLSCTREIPAWPDVQAIDGCAGEVDIVQEQKIKQLFCGYDVIRTFTAVDPCGNLSKESYTLSFRDDVGPRFSMIPEDRVVSCTSDIIPWHFVAAGDDCSGTVPVERSERIVELPCGKDLIRTYTAIDDCGNVSTASYTVRVRDHTAPTLSVPPDVTLACGDALPSALDVSVEDDCGDPQIEFSEVRRERSQCEYDLIRTWTATDRCGNASTKSQTITFEDRQAPVIIPVAPALQGVESTGFIKHFDCELPTMSIADVSVSDDCCALVLDVVVEEQTKGINVCQVFDYTKHYECAYIATDASGKVARLEFDLFVYDTIAPQLSQTPTSRSIDCEEEMPAIPNVSIVDDCPISGNEMIFREDYVFNPQRADQSALVRRWIAVDDCGNSAETMQIIGQCGLDYKLVSGEIESQVWLDVNEDGMKDVQERGINNVPVILYYLDQSSGRAFVADSARTAKRGGLDGIVHFGPLLAGQYRMRYLPGSNLLATKYNATSQGDSDVLPESMMTDFFDLHTHQRIDDVNAGFFEKLDSTGGEGPDQPLGFTEIVQNIRRSGYSSTRDMTNALHSRGRPASSDLQIVPNPVQEELTLQIESYQDEAAHVIIADQWGRLIRTFSIPGFGDHQSATLLVENLPPGMYTLLFARNGMLEHARFVKM